MGADDGAGPGRRRAAQLDSVADAALRVQPGFSGSPVYDDEAGLVVGSSCRLPPGADRRAGQLCDRADRLRLAWPEVLDRRRMHPLPPRAPAATLVPGRLR